MKGSLVIFVMSILGAVIATVDDYSPLWQHLSFINIGAWFIILVESWEEHHGTRL